MADTHKGCHCKEIRMLIILGTAFVVIATVCLLTGSLFVSSDKLNDIKEKALYFNGETIIITEIKTFLHKIIKKSLEDASNPGDSEHVIHLYQLPFSCADLPSIHNYQEYHYTDISQLPLTVVYLLEGVYH